MDEPTVAALVEAFDALSCAECRALRAEIEPLLDQPGDAALAALRRWQHHKDDQHPQLSRYLRGNDS